MPGLELPLGARGFVFQSEGRLMDGGGGEGSLPLDAAD